MKLSIIMPVYNERRTIAEILARVEGCHLADGDEQEVIIVDDGSTDGTRAFLASRPSRGGTCIVFHKRNRGKGAAVRAGLQRVSGDIVLIQDADLEYDPADYPRLLAPIRAGRTQVVYGSRLRAGPPAGMSVSHRLGNCLLTWAANALYGCSLTDLETCYKVFTRAVAERLDLRFQRWGFDPEITAQVLGLGYAIIEVPISYQGRAGVAGKKIGWRHGLTVLGTLIRCRLASPPPLPLTGRMPGQGPAWPPAAEKRQNPPLNCETVSAQVRHRKGGEAYGLRRRY